MEAVARPIRMAMKNSTEEIERERPFFGHR